MSRSLRFLQNLAGAALACALSAVWLVGCGGGSSGLSQESDGFIGTVYGNNVAQVQLTATGSSFTNHCGAARLSAPIQPGADEFQVTGDYPSNVAATEAVYSGQIAGRTMHLTVTDQSTGAVIETLTLTYGVHGEFAVGTCP